MTRIKGTLREDRNTLFIVYRLFLFRMRNVSEKKGVQKMKKKNNLCSVTFFFSENRVVYEIT